MNSRRRRRLKRAGANAPALLGVWGHQPPTSTRRVYTGALLAATLIAHLMQYMPPCGATIRQTKKSKAWEFQSTRPCGGAPPQHPDPNCTDHFNPRSPCGGATAVICGLVRLRLNFNPRPAWGRPFPAFLRCCLRNFNPRPHRGRREYIDIYPENQKFQSTPPHRGRPIA